MDQILQQVQRARRRLWLELFLNRLLTCCFLALLAALVVLAVPKFVALKWLPAEWPVVVAAGAFVIGSLTALAWTWMRSRDDLDAAVEIDHRFQLKERVASSISLTSIGAGTAAGRALVADAERALERVDVVARFPLQLSRQRWLPLAATSLAYLLLSFANDRQAQSTSPTAETTVQSDQIRTAIEAMSRDLEQQQRTASGDGLKGAAGLFERMQDELAELRDSPEVDHQQALVKLNNVASELKRRRDALGAQEGLREQLARSSPRSSGPADEMLDAMHRGDWQAAHESLDGLAEQLESNQFDSSSRETLQRQLSELQESLADSESAHQQAQLQLEQQVEQQSRAGDLDQASQLQQQLNQLNGQQNMMDKLAEMASQLSDLQQSLGNNQQEQANKALAQLQQQMQQFSDDARERKLMDNAVEHFQDAKNAMTCESCQGAGCPDCQDSTSGKPGSQQGEKPGSGVGEGHNTRHRAQQNLPSFQGPESHVPQDVQRGSSIAAGDADGPNTRGEVADAIQQQIRIQGGSPADPQVFERLPRSRQEHAQQYFDSFREAR